MSPVVLLDLVQAVSAAPLHGLVRLPVVGEDPVQLDAMVRAWCERTGNELVEVGAQSVSVRRGLPADPLAGLAPDQVPGTRLWMYTNFDCNLSCDYCCVSSSPRSERRALGRDRVRQLAAEAADAGVSELILTGGEPFLLPDLAELVAACTAVLPTTLLTNGMLFHGRRLQTLDAMDRERLTLQISLDSATSEEHDRHRGAGSWQRAVNGIGTAHGLGFTVKVAATLPAERAHTADELRSFLDSIGVEPRHQVIRALAHQGAAGTGVELTVESLIPEVTVTAEGVYWHPVAAADVDQFITPHIFPLADAIAEVRSRYALQRTRADDAARWFACA
nr:radical SAM protein [uncultured Friedmanniella sp.]